MSETQVILSFWAAVFGGLLLGGAIGLWRGMLWGVAVGCLVIGATASVGAASLAWQRWHFVSQAVLVQGTLVGRKAGGPVVEFRTADRAVHRVTGLGGSQSKAAEGDAVPVRYPAADPSQALVADFQNLWGGVLAFTLFGVLPLAFGAFFLGLAVQGSRRTTLLASPSASVVTSTSTAADGTVTVTTSRRVVSVADDDGGGDSGLSPLRRRLAGNLTIAGNVVMLAGFGAAFFAHDSMAELGRAFLVIGIGATLFSVAFWARRAGDWQAPAICLIVALGFVLFGGGAMLLG